MIASFFMRMRGLLVESASRRSRGMRAQTRTVAGARRTMPTREERSGLDEQSAQHQIEGSIGRIGIGSEAGVPSEAEVVRFGAIIHRLEDRFRCGGEARRFLLQATGSHRQLGSGAAGSVVVLVVVDGLRVEEMASADARRPEQPE